MNIQQKKKKKKGTTYNSSIGDLDGCSGACPNLLDSSPLLADDPSDLLRWHQNPKYDVASGVAPLRRRLDGGGVVGGVAAALAGGIGKRRDWEGRHGWGSNYDLGLKRRIRGD